jgi:cell division protein FtsL
MNLSSDNRGRVYGGTMLSANSGVRDSNYKSKSRRKKISTFNVLLLMVAVATAIVLYVSNVVAVGQLMYEIHKLETRHRELMMEREILNAQVNNLTSLERIRNIAITELGMRDPREAPSVLQSDSKKLSNSSTEGKKSQSK